MRKFRTMVGTVVCITKVTKKEKQYKYGSRRALSRKITRLSTKDEIIQNVDFYLTKGRFYDQIDKKLHCESLQDQLDSIKKEMDEELYETLMEEIQEIKDGTDMVRYYDRGDEFFLNLIICVKLLTFGRFIIGLAKIII